MTDKEKIADAANNVENKYIKNIPENFWFLRFLDQYMQSHKGFIAGGCFKNILSREKVKDVDIFFHNQSDFDEAVASKALSTRQQNSFSNIYLGALIPV